MRRRADPRATRRPIGYWQEFNVWYRAQLEGGDRPPVEIVASWYEENAERIWPQPDDRPTWRETRLHAKCLRTTNEVKTYFQKYRAGKKDRQRSDLEGPLNDSASMMSLVTQHNTRVARMALDGSRSRGSPAMSINPFSQEGPGSPIAAAFSPAAGPPTAMIVTTGMMQVTTSVGASQDVNASLSQRQHAMWKPPSNAGGPNPFLTDLVSLPSRATSFLESDRGTGTGSLRSASMFVKSSTPSIAPEANSGLRCRSMFVSKSDFVSMDVDSPGSAFDFPPRPYEEELLHEFPGLEGPDPAPEGGPHLSTQDKPNPFGQLPFQLPCVPPVEAGCELFTVQDCRMSTAEEGTPDHLGKLRQPSSQPNTHPYHNNPQTPTQHGRSWMAEEGTLLNPLTVEVGTVYFPSADWSGLSESNSGGNSGSNGPGNGSSSASGERGLPKLETLLAAQLSKEAPAGSGMLGDVPCWFTHSHMGDMPSWVPPGTIPEEALLQGSMEAPNPTGSATVTANTLGTSLDSAFKLDTFPDRVQGPLPSYQGPGPSSSGGLRTEAPSLVRRMADMSPAQATASPRRPRLYYEHIFAQQQGQYQAPLCVNPSSDGKYPLPQTRSATVQTQLYGADARLKSPKGSLPATWGTVVTTSQPGMQGNPGNRSKPESPFLAGLTSDLSKDASNPSSKGHGRPPSGNSQSYSKLLEQRSRSMQIPKSEDLEGSDAQLCPQHMHRSGSCPEDPNYSSALGAIPKVEVVEQGMNVDSPMGNAQSNMGQQEGGWEWPVKAGVGTRQDASSGMDPGLSSTPGFAQASDSHPVSLQATEELAAWRASQSFDWMQGFIGRNENSSLALPELSGSALRSWKSSVSNPHSKSTRVTTSDERGGLRDVCVAAAAENSVPSPTDQQQTQPQPTRMFAEIPHPNPGADSCQPSTQQGAYVGTPSSSHASEAANSPSLHGGHQITTGSTGPLDTGGALNSSQRVQLPPQLRSPWGSPARAMSCLLPPVSKCLKQPGGRKQ